MQTIKKGELTFKKDIFDVYKRTQQYVVGVEKAKIAKGGKRYYELVFKSSKVKSMKQEPIQLLERLDTTIMPSKKGLMKLYKQSPEVERQLLRQTIVQGRKEAYQLQVGLKAEDMVLGYDKTLYLAEGKGAFQSYITSTKGIGIGVFPRRTFAEGVKKSFMYIPPKGDKVIGGARGKLVNVFKGREIPTIPIVKKKLDVPIIRTLTPKVPSKTITTFKDSLPKMVGGTGLVLSQGLISNVKPFVAEEFIYAPKFMPSLTGMAISSEIKLEQRGFQVETTNQFKTIGRQFKMIKQEQYPVIKQQQFQMIKQKQLQLSKQKQLQLLRQQQTTSQISKQQQQTTQSLRQKPAERLKQPPQQKLTPTIILPPLLSLSKRILKKVKEEPSIFEVFVTKKGEDVLIGKERTKERAEKILKKSLVGTLRAGGYITKGGIPLEFGELKGFDTGEFGRSKISRFKVIELKEKRLRRGTTAKEIQYFKKSKQRKGNLLGL